MLDWERQLREPEPEGRRGRAGAERRVHRRATDRAEPPPDRALGGDPRRDEAPDAAAPEAARAGARSAAREPGPGAHPWDLRRPLQRARGLRRPGSAPLGDEDVPALPVSALTGVRVLDLTRFLAGPFCTAILADMGADVVKVEAPRGGDEGRYGYPTAGGVPVFFLALNRNKRGITLDLRHEEGRALLRRLLPHFDVLVENFAGGTLAGWGFDPPALCRDQPRLIVGVSPASGRRGRGAGAPPTTSSPRRRVGSCRSPA